jgi:hypothetical protein
MRRRTRDTAMGCSLDGLRCSDKLSVRHVDCGGQWFASSIANDSCHGVLGLLGFVGEDSFDGAVEETCEFEG